MLRAAPRIVVTGESYAAPIAESFARMLRDAGLPAIYVGGDSTSAHCAGTPGAQRGRHWHDPCRRTFGVAKVLRYARQQGALTLACTPSLSSQAARAAEHLLYAPGETEGTCLA